MYIRLQTEREDLLLTDVFDRKAATVEMEALMQETGDVTHTESNRNYSQQWAALGTHSVCVLSRIHY